MGRLAGWKGGGIWYRVGELAAGARGLTALSARGSTESVSGLRAAEAQLDAQGLHLQGFRAGWLSTGAASREAVVVSDQRWAEPSAGRRSGQARGELLFSEAFVWPASAGPLSTAAGLSTGEAAGESADKSCQRASRVGGGAIAQGHSPAAPCPFAIGARLEESPGRVLVSPEGEPASTCWEAETGERRSASACASACASASASACACARAGA